MGYFWKVVGFWSLFLVISLGLVAYTNYDRTLIGLTIGIIIGFLRAFVFNVLSDLRSWNVENIEKIYALLMSEINDLSVYFSGAKKLEYGEELFDYREIRGGHLRPPYVFTVQPHTSDSSG